MDFWYRLLLYLIEILHQTTTSPPSSLRYEELYLIEILHQTTTRIPIAKGFSELYLIEILHQTTTADSVFPSGMELYLIEILHQTTTFVLPMRRGTLLYLIEILHQTTTSRSAVSSLIRCILSKFYIKPQHSQCHFVILGVVSYRNSTSNHNRQLVFQPAVALYLIEILHQTTTPRRSEHQ